MQEEQQQCHSAIRQNTCEESGFRAYLKSINPDIEIPTGSTSESLAQIRADSYNEMQGNLTGYNCKYCNNRGYIAIVKDGDDLRRECTCMEIRRMLNAASESGLQNMLTSYTFQKYNEPEQWQKIAKNTAILYSEKSGFRDWMFIGGQSGSGKTHLATAACGKMLKRGFTVHYEMWRDLLHKLEATRYKLEQQDDIMRIMHDCDVLYIDDFLKTGSNKTPQTSDLSFAYEIINTRYNMNKRLVLSSEFMLDEIASFDEALAGRILQYSKNYRIQIQKDSSKNYRNRGN